MNKLVTYALLLFISCCFLCDLHAREFKGHLGVDFIDKNNNTFFIRKMVTLSDQYLTSFGLLSSAKKELRPKDKYLFDITITDYQQESYSGKLKIVHFNTNSIIVSRKFSGVLNGKSSIDYQERDFKLTLRLDIDKVFTMEEIKKRFKEKNL